MLYINIPIKKSPNEKAKIMYLLAAIMSFLVCFIEIIDAIL